MNKEYDAIFIHGQGYCHREGRKTEPSMRGRLQASAVKVMLRSGYKYEKYLFSGIPFKNEELAMAELNSKAVQKKAGLSEDDIITDQTARTTQMEIAFAKKTAVENNWKRYMHLTYGPVHQDQISQHVNREFAGTGIEVDVFRADEILVNPALNELEDRNLRRYQRVVGNYNHSETEEQVLEYEMRKYLFMNWPFDLGNKLLNVVSKYYRPDPSQ